MTSSEHTDVHDHVAVASTREDAAAAHRQAAWSVWLHGSVAAVHDQHRLVLIVPMDEPTPAAVALARRLHALGNVTVLDAA